MTHTERARAYCESVISGDTPACGWIIKACQRHLNDLDRVDAEDFPYYFDTKAAEKPCKFISLLPHVKGNWASKAELIHLEDWQCFVIACIFGWKRKSDDLRRFRRAYLCVPRKNGKSIIAAGIGLYMFAADGEFGAEVYSGANSEKQAYEIFRPAKQMIERSPKLRERLGIHVAAKGLSIQSNGSRLEAVIGKPGDGASPSAALCDEFHEADTDELIDTMSTGMGARLQPLLLIVTTAGANPAGPCRMLQSELEKMLDGTIQVDDTFAAIWTIDRADDWRSIDALKKANPNFGVSVYETFLIAKQQEALRDARKQAVFLTKHLNMWVSAKSAWLNMQWWNACQVATEPEEIKGAACYAAVDLASKLDIAGVVLIWKFKRDGQDYYYTKGRYYIPEEVMDEPEAQHYTKWVAEGHLTTTEGNVIDYGRIQADLEADITRYRIREMAFDPWNAEQFAQAIGKTRCTPVEVPPQVRHLSEPMKEVEALIKSGRLLHDGCPVLTWMMGNVVAKEDEKGNIFPVKEKKGKFGPKIDGAFALIMGMARALGGAAHKSVYATRGLRTL